MAELLSQLIDLYQQFDMVDLGRMVFSYGEPPDYFIELPG